MSVDVKQLFIDEIETFGYPVMLQGTLAEDEQYPESFFTFWNNSTYDREFYDNVGYAVVWDFDLNFYSTDAEKVNTMLKSAKAALKKRGFIIDGVGYDIVSDEPTHTGRGLNVLYIERVN